MCENCYSVRRSVIAVQQHSRVGRTSTHPAKVWRKYCSNRWDRWKLHRSICGIPQVAVVWYETLIRTSKYFCPFRSMQCCQSESKLGEWFDSYSSTDWCDCVAANRWQTWRWWIGSFRHSQCPDLVAATIFLAKREHRVRLHFLQSHLPSILHWISGSDRRGCSYCSAELPCARYSSAIHHHLLHVIVSHSIFPVQNVRFWNSLRRIPHANWWLNVFRICQSVEAESPAENLVKNHWKSIPSTHKFELPTCNGSLCTSVNLHSAIWSHFDNFNAT